MRTSKFVFICACGWKATSHTAEIELHKRNKALFLDRRCGHMAYLAKVFADHVNGKNTEKPCPLINREPSKAWHRATLMTNRKLVALGLKPFKS